jgi:hypothetical protein
MGLLMLAMAGWLGLATLVNNTSPTAPARAIFLALLFVAVGATVSFLLVMARQRLGTPTPRKDAWRDARRGVLAAIALTLSAWLRMQEALDWTGALLLLGAAVVVEVLFVTRG